MGVRCHLLISRKKALSVNFKKYSEIKKETEILNFVHVPYPKSSNVPFEALQFNISNYFEKINYEKVTDTGLFLKY